ncbi:NAD(P)/FAD-dependent oxidoreductase [Pseudahrensia aquimaris]|uniref:NAD(P)/FAD-dependent oxidoreductase n=1 Tax=Pseudahrensia aquimaris TaxID=744461 RepID=A0ABW3FA89_9HYPH
MSQNPKVIIIGGGYGGLRTAASLKDQADVTVIDRNDYFHHKAAALRGLVARGWSERIYVDFTDIGMDATFLQAEVAQIDPQNRAITLTDGTAIPFDYLVIATGSTTKLPTEQFGLSGATAHDRIGQAMQTYTKAKRVIIVGDGPVGVEMAGEYRDLSPNIEITLVSSAKAPMATVGNETFSARVTDLLERQKVKRIGGRMVEEIGANHVTLNNGERLEADIIVQAVGITPNTEWIKSFAPDWLDERGQVRVGLSLNVIGQDHIFALGDCSDIAEPKMLKMADNQGKYLASAIMACQNGQASQPYERFAKKLTILPFGAKDGVALLPIGKEGTVVWRPLGRFMVVKRKGMQLLSNMFPGSYV